MKLSGSLSTPLGCVAFDDVGEVVTVLWGDGRFWSMRRALDTVGFLAGPELKEDCAVCSSHSTV